MKTRNKQAQTHLTQENSGEGKKETPGKMMQSIRKIKTPGKMMQPI